MSDVKVKEWVSGPGKYVEKTYTFDELRSTFTKGELVWELMDQVERLTQENARKDDEIMALHQIGSMDDLREIASKCAQRDYCSCAPCEMSYCVTQRFVAELQRKLDAAGPAGEVQRE